MRTLMDDRLRTEPKFRNFAGDRGDPRLGEEGLFAGRPCFDEKIVDVYHLHCFTDAESVGRGVGFLLIAGLTITGIV